jgi:hypothetical protein
MLRRAAPSLWIAGVAGALWLIFPFGFPAYDARYALVWGYELAHGISPDYGVLQPPTPHPLADLWGALVAPLGAAGASDATTVVAYLALAAIGYLVYRLGALWFDRPIGVVAALLVLTRVPYLSNGLRAYVDLPYIALVLTSLVIETRRPRAGWPVLALLTLAGLLRPEAWLFSSAYLAYLVLERNPDHGGLAMRRRAAVDRRHLVAMVIMAAAAPLIWASFDLITAGDPLYSLTETQRRVESLQRKTGPVNLILHGPTVLGQVLQWPGLIGAAAGIALGLAFLRRRAQLGVTSIVLAGSAFAVLACTGVAIIPRYTMLASALLCVFCALVLLGWRMLPASRPWRRRWQVIAAAIAVGFVVQAPQQRDFLSSERTKLRRESRLESDLQGLADSGAFDRYCQPISVTYGGLVPRLAAWLDLRPSAIVILTEQSQPSHGYVLDPATRNAVINFGTARIPPRFAPVARNRSWVLYARCG